MSTMFWNTLKLSPALLSASFLLANSAYAQQIVSNPIAAATPSPTEVTVDSMVDSLAQEAQIEVEETPVSQIMPSQSSVVAQQVPTADDVSSDNLDVLEQLQNYTSESETSTEPLDQVTNVNQLRDVSPGDWAYEALRSLVERYGCIVGYPDGTYRGNRATTRFEFAAGLNACLNQIERLIAASTEGFVRREDLETLQRLVQEFQVELVTLGTRVDTLEGRVAFLEENLFSTTTRLNAEVIMAVSDTFGDIGANAQNDDNTVFQNRVRLNFDTSFTGSDRLRTRLQAGNINPFTDVRSITNEGRLGFETDTDNNFALDTLSYRFDVGPARVQLFANGGGLDDFALTLNPLDSSGSGSISRFGQRNPIYRMGGGGAGAGITLGRTGPFRIDLGYLGRLADDPGDDSGIFNGDYGAIGQLTFQPSDRFRVAATYVHSYNRDNLRHGTGSRASQVGFDPAGPATTNPVVGNSYGLEATFALTPQIILSGWAGYTNAIIIGQGNADVWNWAATLALSDFGPEGSLLGFVVGMEPKVTNTDGNVFVFNPAGSAARRDDPDTGLHIEGFYKLALTNNISITPGIIWLTAPGHNSDNDDVIIGTVRTTFTF